MRRLIEIATERRVTIVMFVVVMAALMLGYPVAFTLGATAMLFGGVALGLDFFTLLPLPYSISMHSRPINAAISPAHRFMISSSVRVG